MSTLTEKEYKTYKKQFQLSKKTEDKLRSSMPNGSYVVGYCAGGNGGKCLKALERWKKELSNV